MNLYFSYMEINAIYEFSPATYLQRAAKNTPVF